MSYDEDGFVLRRGLLPSATFKRLHEVAVRVHALWLEEQGEDARRKDLVNSHSLTCQPIFSFGVSLPEHAHCPSSTPSPTTVLPDDLVSRKLFGEELYFHGTQMFFNPLGGARNPYWHRDIQYLPCDESQQAALLSELCNLHIRVPLRPEQKIHAGPGQPCPLGHGHRTSSAPRARGPQQLGRPRISPSIRPGARATF